MIEPSGPALRIEVHATLGSIDAAAWNRLAGDQLFMRHELLRAYGEYVFDWTWADAHQHSGLPCFPKLLRAVPFAPVSGVRLLAESDAKRELPVAGALDFHCGDRVYGRYWGGTEWHSGLHFETCYCQSIEYCIAHYVDELNEHAPFRSNRAPGDGAG